MFQTNKILRRNQTKDTIPIRPNITPQIITPSTNSHHFRNTSRTSRIKLSISKPPRHNNFHYGDDRKPAKSHSAKASSCKNAHIATCLTGANRRHSNRERRPDLPIIFSSQDYANAPPLRPGLTHYSRKKGVRSLDKIYPREMGV